MARCGECNKFTGLETQDPEVQDVQFDFEDMKVMAEVRVVRSCADCSTEMKETTLELEAPVDRDKLLEHFEKEHATEVDLGDENDWAAHVSASDDGGEPTERTEGKGRGTRSFYGAKVEVSLDCDLCLRTVLSVTLEGDEQASSFEECC